MLVTVAPAHAQLRGHGGPLCAPGVPAGPELVSVGYDRTVRIWPVAGGAATIVTLPAPLNAVAVARDGEIAAGAADGSIHFLARDGALAGAVEATKTPIGALAVSPDG